MNVAKIQLDLLKHLLKKPEHIAVQYSAASDEFFVSWDNITFFCLNYDELRVNLSDVHQTIMFDELLRSDLRRMIRLVPTDHYRVGGSVRQYLYDGRDDKPVYVKVSNLAYFENPTLLVREGYTSSMVIVVTEYPFGAENDPVVRGLTLNYRVRTEESEPAKN